MAWPWPAGCPTWSSSNGSRSGSTKALEQEVEELRTFAREGIDPATGVAFAEVERLLFVALQRNIPDERQTFLTLIDGEVRHYPMQVGRVELERSADLVERVGSLEL